MFRYGIREIIIFGYLQKKQILSGSMPFTFKNTPFITHFFATKSFAKTDALKTWLTQARKVFFNFLE